MGGEGGRKGRPRRSKQRSPRGLDWAGVPSCVRCRALFPLVAEGQTERSALCGVWCVWVGVRERVDPFLGANQTATTSKEEEAEETHVSSVASLPVQMWVNRERQTRPARPAQYYTRTIALPFHVVDNLKSARRDQGGGGKGSEAATHGRKVKMRSLASSCCPSSSVLSPSHRRTHG